mmetsp:Transcript_35437/g.58697  ORF Transcript_35437/g.58697 Transcript_35437/m.58697 type:complete len:296 (-) Transcript_35437:374-1261(-)
MQLLSIMIQTRSIGQRSSFRSRSCKATYRRPDAAHAASAKMKLTSHAVPGQGRPARSQRHSQEILRQLLLALSKPIADFERRTLLMRLCDGIVVWRGEDWDPAWRRAANSPAVIRAVAEAARLAAPDFRAGVHIPREAAEQIQGLAWPEYRTDFLAFAMPGFCHCAAAVAHALASAARPHEEWVIVVSQLHAAVLSMSSATLVDFNAVAVDPGEADLSALTYLQRLILPTEQWAIYPELEMYIENLKPSIQYQCPIPAWAQPRGCDRPCFERLVASGQMDAAFVRGQQMLVQPPT